MSMMKPMNLNKNKAMKKITQLEAQTQIEEILTAFNLMVGKNVMRMTAIIENVGIVDLTRIHADLPKDKCRLYIPGEIGNENISIIYVPAPGCTICIESEPCVNYRPKINLINYN